MAMKAGTGSSAKKLERVERVEHLHEDRGMIDDMDPAKHRQHQEIDEHDRAEQRPDLGRSARLDREQADEDPDRDRHDPGLEAGVDRRQPLDRRQDRDRRGDHAVAVEQGGGEHAEQDDADRATWSCSPRPSG